MPRPCTICGHLEREAIDTALVANTSYRNIAVRFGTSVAALQRHKAEHIPALLATARQRQGDATATHGQRLVDQARAQQDHEDAHALDVMAELQRCFQRVNLLFDACDRWLRDADDPTRYDVGPRADDVQVTYVTTGDDGKPVRRKAPLSSLLARAEGGGGVMIERTETRIADPRELVLKTAQQLTGQTQLLAKLLGQLDERPQINVVASPEWLQVRAALLTALIPHPDARRAVAAALVAIDAASPIEAA